MGNTISTPPQLDLDTLEPWIQDRLRDHRVPGVQVAVVSSDKVLFAGGFGTCEVGRDLAITDHTVFAHGSTGKAFTSFLIGTLVDDRLVEWDVPLREYAPEVRFHDPVTSERVTLRDLLCHRTGLVAGDLIWVTQPDLSRAEFIRRIRYIPPLRDFRH